MSSILENGAVGTGLSIDDLVATPGSMPPPPAVATPAPKKAAAKKKATPVVAKTETAEEIDGTDGDVAAPTPKKKKAAPKKKAVKVEASVEGVEAADGEPPVTPVKNTPVKRAPKAKAVAVPTTPTVGEDGKEIPVPASTPAKSTGKRAATKAADGETPTKKPKATPAKAKASAKGGKVAFPTCWEEFSEEDKLIMNLRKNDKMAWPEIDTELEKITGVKPGKDSTRKRFAKLDAVSTHFPDEDVAKIAAAKAFVDAEIEEAIKIIQESIKKKTAERWSKVAEQMKTMGVETTYKAAALEKKYEQLVSSGLIKDGIYVGSVELSLTNGDVKSETNDEVNDDSKDVSNSDDAPVEDDMLIDGEGEQEA